MVNNEIKRKMRKKISKELSWIVWSHGPIDDPVCPSRLVSRESARCTPWESLLMFFGLVTNVCSTSRAPKQCLFDIAKLIECCLLESKVFVQKYFN